MKSSSADLDATARKNLSRILLGVAEIGLDPIAATLGVDKSTVSRWKDQDLQRFSVLLSLLGLKVVPTSLKCFDERKIDALLTLADGYLDRIRHAEQLAENDA